MKARKEYTIAQRNKADNIYKLILMMTIIVFIIMFSWLYKISKNNLINLQYSEVQSLNKDVAYILENRRHKIAEDAMVLEKYISDGKTNDELLTYLSMEHSIMVTLDAEYSDFYGYIRGEYLDGSGWEPDETFIPKERPWYLAGKKYNGDIGFASPYIDAISGNLIISYTKLLSDGESVISYDVQLTNMQKLVAETVNDKCLETIIIDENETILADSQTQNISLHFSELTDGYYNDLYNVYRNNLDNNFELKCGNYHFYVYNNAIADGMKQLVLVDAKELFAPLRKALLYGIILFIIITASVVAIIRDINKRRKIAEEDLVKIKDLYFEANTDILTGLYNRRAYEDKLAKISEKGISDNLVYFSFDLNGLKTANDTKGHSEGDKLITGASYVLKQTWEPYGRLYRIGGDEFAAILELSSDDLAAAEKKFAEEISKWSSDNNADLSISYGFCEREEFKDATMREIIDLADECMYREKARYYQQSGKDRRRR